MSKRKRSGVLNRLSGKRLVFSGKFGYGVEELLKALAEAQQGTVCDDLDAKVDYLVLPDLGAGKTIQKKALSLNAKGAAIQLIDADAFKKLAEPTGEEVLALLRGGQVELYSKIRAPEFYYAHLYHGSKPSPRFTFHSEDFGDADLTNAHLDDIEFVDCSFVGAKLNNARIASASDCDFSRATGESAEFDEVVRCRFKHAALSKCHFSGDFSGCDFTNARLAETSFTDAHYYFQGKPAKTPLAVLFTNAKLMSASFDQLHLKSPDFCGADLTKAGFENATIDAGTFCNATLREALLVGCKLVGSDLTGADLTGAHLADADLTGSTLAGTNLKDANLRGTTLDRVDLSKANNYDPKTTVLGAVGSALKELDLLAAKAKRIHVRFRVRCPEIEDGEEVAIDTSALRWNMGLQLPQSVQLHRLTRVQSSRLTFSDALMYLARIASHLPIRFETVEVSSTKSPTGGKELRDLVMRGIAEAFAQEIPPEEELAEATKTYRAAEREKGAAERERREQAKAAAAKQKEKANKQIAKKIEKAVGKVSDVGSFLKALEVRIEKPKIDKATKMLKASGFKLFNDVTGEHVSGVVKSQTDPDLVYACRVASDGQYACCTQNLNICGGLRGSICKHLLVLIIGLVQAGELDPTTIDEWIAKTHSGKPELDKEIMGSIFIKYKGAEAGEVDWRPTETVPEDYYTL